MVTRRIANPFTSKDMQVRVLSPTPNDEKTMTTYLTNNPLGSVQMMPDEVDYVVNAIQDLPDDGLMVEWGSGGSTLHWLKTLRPTQKLYSIEHNPDWAQKVADRAKEYSNFRLYFTDVSSKYHNHTYGSVDEENPFNTANYVCPSTRIYNADLYLIDGIARGACLAGVLLNRKKQNSVILMHDYSLRVPAYDWITQFCKVEHIGTTLVKLTSV